MESLEALVRTYSRLIRSVASRVGGGVGRARDDDIAQEVFLSLWKRIEGEQPIEFPTSYVYRCAVHETLRVLRAEHVDNIQSLDSPAEAVDPPDPRADPEVQAAGSEVADAVDAVLADLALDRRRAVRARLAGFTVEDLMTMYGWSYQKARNLIARGMNDLRLGLRARGIHG